MAVYRVVGKAHIRATFATQQAVDTLGNPYTVIHAGNPVRLEAGGLIEDLTPAELQAFPDRFVLVEGEPLAPVAPQTLNPEVMALVQRAHAGTASNDEQAVVGDVLAFVAGHLAGTATSEDAAALAAKLADFGLELFL